MTRPCHNLHWASNFRGFKLTHYQIYAALASLLVAEKLVIIPRYVERAVTEQETKGGGMVFHVALRAKFKIVCTIDGSYATTEAFGEAMDPGDKATTKSMSAAYKAMCIQLFCIPVEGSDNDADASTFRASSRGNGMPQNNDRRQPSRPQNSTPQAQRSAGPAPASPGTGRALQSSPPMGSAPPKPQNVPMTQDEAEEAERRVDQAFSERGISQAHARGIKSGLLRARRFANVRDAGRDFLERLIHNIESGMYDGKNGTSANGGTREVVRGAV